MHNNKELVEAVLKATDPVDLEGAEIIAYATIEEIERRLKQWPPCEALWREGVYK